MRPVACAVLPLLALACLATPSPRSEDCREWSSLSRAQKEDKLVSMSDDLLAGAMRERYASVERVRIRDCVRDRLPEIRFELDANCRASMRRRLVEILKDHIRRCEG